MKKLIAAVIASVALMGVGCQSVESAKVDPSTIASNGEAVALVQCTALGLSALFNFITITEASMDTVVNKMMIAEAKALGGNRVQLLSAAETPKNGLIFRLIAGILTITAGQASGIAVR